MKEKKNALEDYSIYLLQKDILMPELCQEQLWVCSGRADLRQGILLNSSSWEREVSNVREQPKWHQGQCGRRAGVLQEWSRSFLELIRGPWRIRLSPAAHRHHAEQISSCSHGRCNSG